MRPSWRRLRVCLTGSSPVRSCWLAVFDPRDGQGANPHLRAPTDPDADLVRAARHISGQISIAFALVEVIVAVLAFALGPLLHPVHLSRMESCSDDEASLRDALLIAGLTGILIAGLVGFISARRRRWATPGSAASSPTPVTNCALR